MGRVIHFEIHAVNPDRAMAFYRAVLGWEFQQWGAVEYWIVSTGPQDRPGINGGLLPRKGGSPLDGQAVNAYVCTADVESVDETVARALGAGGSLAVAKVAVPTVGWLAYLKDTEGNIFGVMQTDPGAK